MATYRVIIIACLALSTGCWSGEFDLSRLSPEQAEIVQRSIDRYAALGCSFGTGVLGPRTINVYMGDLGDAKSEGDMAVFYDGGEVGNQVIVFDDTDYRFTYTDECDPGTCDGSGAECILGEHDFETVAMHEVGHAAGLRHSAPNDWTSVMLPGNAPCLVNRDLSPSDLAQIRQVCQ